VLRTIPAGWRNNPSQPQRVLYGELEVGYRLRRDGDWDVAVGGDERAVRVRGTGDDWIDLDVGGLRRRLHVVQAADAVHVDSALGADTLRPRPRLPRPVASEAPGSLRAPMPGRVSAVHVEPGAAVTAGDVLLVLEAMKMEHAITAPFAATVQSLLVEEGRQVSADDVLVVLVETAASG
jgi:propionyl-CoA carboxylase alpha chain